MVFMCVFCVFMLRLLGGGELSKNPHLKKSEIIVVCSGLEKILEIPWIYAKMTGYVKDWKIENVLRPRPSLANDTWDIFWLTSFFQKLYPHLKTF